MASLGANFLAVRRGLSPNKGETKRTTRPTNNATQPAGDGTSKGAMGKSASRKTAASPVNKAKAKKAMTMNKCKEDKAKPKKELQAKVLHATLEQIAKLV